MVLPSLNNERYQENASATEASAIHPLATIGVFLCADEDGLSLGRFRRRPDDTENNQPWILEHKWKVGLPNKPRKFHGNENAEKEENVGVKANCVKSLEIDTTLSLALPGTQRKNDVPYIKNLVSSKSPSQISLVSKGRSNRAENVPKPNNKEHRLICVGCTHCNIRFTIKPMTDPKCPKCDQTAFLLDAFPRIRGNKRARKN